MTTISRSRASRDWRAHCAPRSRLIRARPARSRRPRERLGADFLSLPAKRGGIRNKRLPMRIYTVHEPPRRDDELVAHTARFQFVRDGFHFWAFLLAPLWMLLHRLWLEFIVYALVVGGITFALRRFGLAETAGLWMALLLAIL